MILIFMMLLTTQIPVPRVQAVVYCTRSLIEAENEGVVNKVIEYINLMYQKKTPFKVSPPVISLTKENIEEENPVIGKFLRYLPSNVMSGCFVATITREVGCFLSLCCFSIGSPVHSIMAWIH